MFSPRLSALFDFYRNKTDSIQLKNSKAKSTQNAWSRLIERQDTKDKREETKAIDRGEGKGKNQEEK